MKSNNEKGFTKRVSNEVFESRAQKEIDTNVRHQVNVYERLQTDKTKNKPVLTPDQKAHLAWNDHL